MYLIVIKIFLQVLAIVMPMVLVKYYSLEVAAVFIFDYSLYVIPYSLLVKSLERERIGGYEITNEIIWGGVGYLSILIVVYLFFPISPNGIAISSLALSIFLISKSISQYVTVYLVDFFSKLLLFFMATEGGGQQLLPVSFLLLSIIIIFKLNWPDMHKLKWLFSISIPYVVKRLDVFLMQFLGFQELLVLSRLTLMFYEFFLGFINSVQVYIFKETRPPLFKVFSVFLFLLAMVIVALIQIIFLKFTLIDILKVTLPLIVSGTLFLVYLYHSQLDDIRQDRLFIAQFSTLFYSSSLLIFMLWFLLYCPSFYLFTYVISMFLVIVLRSFMIRRIECEKNIN